MKQFGVAPTGLRVLPDDEVMEFPTKKEAEDWIKEWETDGNQKGLWYVVSRESWS